MVDIAKSLNENKNYKLKLYKENSKKEKELKDELYQLDLAKKQYIVSCNVAVKKVVNRYTNRIAKHHFYRNTNSSSAAVQNGKQLLQEKSMLFGDNDFSTSSIFNQSSELMNVENVKNYQQQQQQPRMNSFILPNRSMSFSKSHNGNNSNTNNNGARNNTNHNHIHNNNHQNHTNSHNHFNYKPNEFKQQSINSFQFQSFNSKDFSTSNVNSAYNLGLKNKSSYDLGEVKGHKKVVTWKTILSTDQYRNIHGQSHSSMARQPPPPTASISRYSDSPVPSEGSTITSDSSDSSSFYDYKGKLPKPKINKETIQLSKEDRYSAEIKKFFKTLQKSNSGFHTYNTASGRPICGGYDNYVHLNELNSLSSISFSAALSQKPKQTSYENPWGDSFEKQKIRKDSVCKLPQLEIINTPTQSKQKPVVLLDDNSEAIERMFKSQSIRNLTLKQVL